MYLKKIEELTSSILDDSGVKMIPVPIMKIAKKHGLHVKKFDFGNEISGALVIDNGKGTIGYNPKENIVRQRFTIAHELGHFILHKNLNETLFVDKNFKVHFRDYKSSTGESLREQEANSFAAAILMPIERIKEELVKADYDLTDENQLKKLAKKFNVSTQAMTYRLANLHIF